jgi:hypothetical protein
MRRDPKGVVDSTPDAAIRLKYRMAIRTTRPHAEPVFPRGWFRPTNG